MKKYKTRNGIEVGADTKKNQRLISKKYGSAYQNAFTGSPALSMEYLTKDWKKSLRKIVDMELAK